jgi:hypothetical protein
VEQSPAATAPVVDRGHLVQRIVSSGARIVTLIAPAGYGKSRLARQLGARYGTLRTIDCADAADPLNAASLIVRALALIEPAVEEQLGRRLLSLSYGDVHVEQVHQLVRDAVAASSAESALCLDNMEALAENPLLLRVLDTLVRSLNRPILLCSRTDIGLPVLARTAPNDRYDVGIRELQFTPAESIALFHESGAPSADVERAVRLAQGWPIAVLTFVRFARENRLQVSLSQAEEGGGFDILGQYMLSQALNRISEPVRAVLSAIARIGVVSTSELQLMTGDAATVLAEIRSSPFCIESSEGLSLHPLARAALRAGPEGTKPLRRAALASALESPTRAARFYLAVGDDDAAAAVLDTRIAPYMLAQPTAEMATLISEIRPDVLVRYQATWSATITHRSYAVDRDTLLYESRIAFATLPSDTPVELRIGVAGILLNFLFYAGHYDEADALLAKLSDTFLNESVQSIPRVVLRIWQYVSDIRLGKYVEHRRAWEDVGAILGATPSSLAQWQYTFAGPIAFFEGDRDASRRAFDRAVTLSAQPGSEIVYAIALKNVVFHAWLAGDQDLFAECTRRLSALDAPNVINGTRFFVGCVTDEHPADVPTGLEMLYTRAFGALIAASRETEPARRARAFRTAVDAAVEDGQPWLNAVVHLARGLALPDDRHEAFASARACAERVEYDVFRANVESVISGNVPENWRGLRGVEDGALSRLSMEFASRNVSVDGKRITLAQREIELFLALALATGARDRKTLAAMLWPDLEEASAQNAVRVLVSRLRAKLGCSDLIRSTPAGYELSERPDLDVFLIETALATGRAAAIGPELRERLGRSHERLPQWMLLSDWLAPYVRRYERAIDRIRAAFAADARSVGRPEEAVRWEGLRTAEDVDGLGA